MSLQCLMSFLTHQGSPSDLSKILSTEIACCSKIVEQIWENPQASNEICLALKSHAVSLIEEHDLILILIDSNFDFDRASTAKRVMDQ